MRWSLSYFLCAACPALVANYLREQIEWHQIVKEGDNEGAQHYDEEEGDENMDKAAALPPSVDKDREPLRRSLLLGAKLTTTTEHSSQPLSPSDSRTTATNGEEDKKHS